MEASTIMKHNAETNVKNAAESFTTKTTEGGGLGVENSSCCVKTKEKMGKVQLSGNSPSLTNDAAPAATTHTSIINRRQLSCAVQFHADYLAGKLV